MHRVPPSLEGRILMKKIVAVVCALAFALAMPCMAFAANSPYNPTQTKTATSDMGSTLTISTSYSGDLWATATSTFASNVVTDDNNVVIGSFEVGIGPNGTHDSDAEAAASSQSFSFNFAVDSSYNGKTAKIYIQNADGTVTVQTVTVQNGSVYVTLTGLAQYYTIVIDKASAATNVNGSSTSPQTGVNFAGGIAAVAGLTVVAGGVALALRKKVTE